MSKKIKIPLIVLGAILFVVCLLVDCSYIYIKYFSGEKVMVRNTFYLGMQTLADGETKKTFLEVKYHQNTKGNGIELLDIKYNYLMDENKEKFFSQGLQYYGTAESNVKNSYIEKDFDNFVKPGTYVKKSYKYTDKGFCGWNNSYYHYWYVNYSPENVYCYSSIDDYETTTLSTNPIGTGSTFMVDISGKTYMMMFKDQYKIVSEKNYVAEELGFTKSYPGWRNKHYYTYYAYQDYTFFNKLVFNSIKTMTPGTNQYIVLEFGDLFDYYVFNEETARYELVVKQTYLDEAKQIDKNAKVDSSGLLDKLYKQVNSYFTIKVSVTEDGAQRASDSLFNSLMGSQNYVLPGVAEEDSYSGYFVGKSLITLTIDNFEDVYTDGGLYLGLTEETKHKYYSYRDKIKFVIYIDNCNPNALGLYAPSLDGFDYEKMLWRCAEC